MNAFAERSRQDVLHNNFENKQENDWFSGELDLEIRLSTTTVY